MPTQGALPKEVLAEASALASLMCLLLDVPELVASAPHTQLQPQSPFTQLLRSSPQALAGAELRGHGVTGEALPAVLCGLIIPMACQHALWGSMPTNQDSNSVLSSFYSSCQASQRPRLGQLRMIIIGPLDPHVQHHAQALGTATSA